MRGCTLEYKKTAISAAAAMAKRRAAILFDSQVRLDRRLCASAVAPDLGRGCPPLGRSLITLSKVSRQVPRARTAATPPDLVRLLYCRTPTLIFSACSNGACAAAAAEY